MKKYLLKTAGFGLLAAFMFTSFISCNEKSEQEKIEEREEAKVGKVYDTAYQGIRHENIDNQFPKSRNDNDETNPVNDTATTQAPKNDTIKKQQ